MAQFMWETLGLTREQTLEITHFVYPLMASNVHPNYTSKGEILKKICNRFTGFQQAYAIYLMGFIGYKALMLGQFGRTLELDPNDVDNY